MGRNSSSAKLVRVVRAQEEDVRLADGVQVLGCRIAYTQEAKKRRGLVRIAFFIGSYRQEVAVRSDETIFRSACQRAQRSRAQVEPFHGVAAGAKDYVGA